MTAAHTPTPILADACCKNCQRRIGWHNQFQCPEFEVENLAELRVMYDNWFAENEPTIGFRNDDDVPHAVLVARAALAKVAP